MNANNINKIFNIDSSNTNIIPFDDSATDDYDFVRERLKTIITDASTVLDDAIEISKIAQDFKTYTAVASLVTALTSANKSLADINMKRREIEQSKKVAQEVPSVQNNFLMVGSTKEIQEMINNLLPSTNKVIENDPK